MINIREYYEKDGESLPGKKVYSASLHYALLHSMVPIGCERAFGTSVLREGGRC